MADLETLIDQRLSSTPELIALLASYAGQPAVLLSPMPADVAAEWSADQYPRVEWSVARTVLPERALEGSVLFDAFVRGDDQGSALEAVERALQVALDGTMYHPDEPPGAPVQGLRWARSDDLGTDEPLVFGRRVQFSLFGFPSQEVAQPDAIAALNAATEVQFGLNIQVDPQSWGPSDDIPAIYWRLASLTETSVHTWGVMLEAVIRGHLLAPLPEDRNLYVQSVRAWLSGRAPIRLGDGSPLRMWGVGEERMADPQREGQIAVTARFGQVGSLVWPPPGERIRAARGTGAGSATGASVRAGG